MTSSSTALPDPTATGALSRVGTSQVLEAVRLVRAGHVYDLGLELNEDVPQGSPGAFTPYTFTWRVTPEGSNRGDYYRYAAEAISGTLHTGTHIDGLAHVAAAGRIYGGHDAARVRDDRGFREHGMETVPPIITRAVILDIAGLHGVDALPDGYEVTTRDLQNALRSVRLELRSGDSVLVRTGKVREYGTDNTAYQRAQPGVGRDGAVWLYEQGMAVLGTDTTGTEPLPFADERATTHEAMLVQRGVHLIENLFLDAVVHAGVVEGLFACLPLRLTGATGSWVRPVVIV